MLAARGEIAHSSESLNGLRYRVRKEQIDFWSVCVPRTGEQRS